MSKKRILIVDGEMVCACIGKHLGMTDCYKLLSTERKII
jgi:hypothetical protein